MGNLSRLKTLVATETGALISMYYIVKLSLPDQLDTMRESINQYLIKRFDYEIDSYTEPTTHEFFHIFDVLKGADPKSAGEGAALNYLGEGMYYVAQARRELTIAGARVVNKASWFVLIILALVIVLSLFYSRNGSIGSALITALLCGSSLLALLILDDVDANRFGEEQFAIDTYQDVFKAIDELPYYSKRYLAGGRYKLTEKIYRTGAHGSVTTVEVK